jgi:hypothetical protein
MIGGLACSLYIGYTIKKKVDEINKNAEKKE